MRGGGGSNFATRHGAQFFVRGLRLAQAAGFQITQNRVSDRCMAHDSRKQTFDIAIRKKAFAQWHASMKQLLLSS